jgi:hypothetical protein
MTSVYFACSFAVYDVSCGQLNQEEYLVAPKVNAIHDGNDTIEMNSFVLPWKFPYLNCNRCRKSTSRCLHYNPRRVIFFCISVLWSGTFQFKECIAHSANLSSVNLTRDNTKVQHRHPLSISCTPSIFDSLASSLSTVIRKILWIPTF